MFKLDFFVSLDNDQLGARLLYFTIRPLHCCTCSSTCAQVESELVEPILSLNLCTEWPLTERTIPDAASMRLAS